MIPASFHFVRTEPRARHAPLVFGRCGDFTPWPSSYWAFIAFVLRMRAHVPILDRVGTSKTSVTKNPSTAFSCRKVVWILTLYLSPQLLTWRTLLRQLQPQLFEPTRPPLFEFFRMIGLELGLVHFTIRWSALPFHRRNGWCVTGIFGSLSKLYFVFTF